MLCVDVLRFIRETESNGQVVPLTCTDGEDVKMRPEK